jgi:hypothetical protein
MSPSHLETFPLWRRFAGSRKPKLATKLRDELARAVSGDQIAELVELSCRGRDREIESAIRVLHKVPHERVSDRLRAQWLQCLERQAREHYAHDDLGLAAFSALRSCAPETAERLLLHELDYGRLTEAEIPVVVLELSASPSAEALARLRDLAQRNEVARRAFDRIAGMTKGNVEELASLWRATHKSAPLSDLYWTYITKLPNQASAGDLLALLGPPTDTDGRTHYYQATDSTACLVLQEDAAGRLVTWKLGD